MVSPRADHGGAPFTVDDVAAALKDYIDKLKEFQDSTPSKAAKADYDRTIADVRKLVDAVEADAG